MTAPRMSAYIKPVEVVDQINRIDHSAVCDTFEEKESKSRFLRKNSLEIEATLANVSLEIKVPRPCSNQKNKVKNEENHKKKKVYSESCDKGIRSFYVVKKKKRGKEFMSKVRYKDGQMAEAQKQREKKNVVYHAQASELEAKGLKYLFEGREALFAVLFMLNNVLALLLLFLDFSINGILKMIIVETILCCLFKFVLRYGGMKQVQLERKQVYEAQIDDDEQNKGIKFLFSGKEYILNGFISVVNILGFVLLFLDFTWLGLFKTICFELLFSVLFGFVFELIGLWRIKVYERRIYEAQVGVNYKLGVTGWIVAIPIVVAVAVWTVVKSFVDKQNDKEIKEVVETIVVDEEFDDGSDNPMFSTEKIFEAQVGSPSLDVLCAGRCESCELEENWLPEDEVAVPIDERRVRERLGQHLPCLYLNYHGGMINHGIDCALGFARCRYKVEEDEGHNLIGDIENAMNNYELVAGVEPENVVDNRPKRVSRHALFRVAIREGMRTTKIEPFEELIKEGDVEANGCVVENHGNHVVIAHHKDCPHEVMSWGNKSYLPIGMHKLFLEQNLYRCGKQMRGHIYSAQALFGTELSLSPGTLDLFNRVIDSVREIPQPAQVAEAMGDLSGKVTSDVQKLMLQVPALFALTLATVQLSSGYSNKWFGIFLLASTTIVVLMDGRVAEIIKSMVARIKDKIMAFKAQGDGDGPMVDLVKLFLVIVSVGTVGKSDFKIERWVALVGAIPRASDGLSTICDWVSELLGKAVNFIRTEMLGMDAVAWVSDSDPEIITWCNKVTELANLDHKGQLIANGTNAEKVYRAYTEGNHLLSMTRKGRLYEALKVHKSVLMRMFPRFEHIGMANAGPRMEPVGILLSGASKIGKSYLMFPLIYQILHRVLTPAELEEAKKDFSSQVYVHASGNEYMDNYKAQMVTVIDDFGQARDCVGATASDYLDVIRMVNMFPFMCHMAALEKKGNTLFRSKLVIATTNLPAINPQSVEQPEAVRRRFHVCYKVVPKEEYCLPGTTRELEKRRLNHAHPGLASHIGFNPDVYEFHEFDPINTKLTGKRLNTVAELVDLIVEEYKKKEERSNNYMAYLSSMAQHGNGLYSAEYRAQAGESSKCDIGLTEAQQRFIDETMSEFDRKSELSRASSLKELEDMVQMESIESLTREFDPELVAQVRMFTDFPVGLLRVLKGENPGIFAEVVKSKHKMESYLEIVSRTASWPSLLQRARSEESTESKKLESATRVVREFADSLKIKAKEVWEKYPILKWLGGFTVMAGVLFGALKFMMSGSEEEDEEEHEAEGYHSRGSRRRAKRNIRTVEKITFSEGGADKNADEIIKVMLQNMYRLYNPEGKPFGNMVMAYGRVALIPFHFVAYMKRKIASGEMTEQSMIGCKNPYLSKVYEVPVSVFLDCVQTPDLRELDLCGVRMPKFLHPHKDTESWWVSTNDLHKPLHPVVQLVIPDEVGRRAFVTRAEPTDYFKVSDGHDLWTVRRGFKYSAPTEKGDCGGLLTIVNPSIRGKLIGIHTAGSDDQVGLSSAVTCDLISDLKKELPSIPPAAQVFGAQLCEMPFEGCFAAVSQSPKAIHQPPVNDIYRSCLHGAWGPAKKAPSRLGRFTNSEGELIDPGLIAVQKYGRKMPKWQDERRIKMCMKAGFRQFQNCLELQGRHKPRVFDFDTAVLGIPGVDYCDSINRNKSAGFPWVLDPIPGLKGKQRFFGVEDEFNLTNPECDKLREEVAKVIREAKKGKRSLHVYVDNLKDELRSHEKVKEGKTRLFSGSPIVLLIVMRMYFLDFTMAVQESRISNESLVGINPYSSEWDRLAKRQKEKGDKNSAGDFRGFDTDHQGQRIEAFTECVNEWYDDGEENALVREVLMEDVINSVHMKGDLLYCWFGGIPSGTFLTVHLNTFTNKCILREAFVLLHPRGLLGLPDFETHVNVAVYGDDNILNISDYASVFYNHEKLTEAFAELGYDYTDDTKGLGETRVFRTLEEITILKRSFRFEERLNRYVAPEDLATVLEIPYWVKSKQCIEHITLQNIQTCLRELSLHPREVFDEWLPKILRAVRERMDYVPPIDDYCFLQDIVSETDKFY